MLGLLLLWHVLIPLKCHCQRCHSSVGSIERKDPSRIDRQTGRNFAVWFCALYDVVCCFFQEASTFRQ